MVIGRRWLPCVLVLGAAACGGAGRGLRSAGPPASASAGPRAGVRGVRQPLAPLRVPPGWRFPRPVALVRAPHAMVVTDAPLATRVGVEVLRAGGNAIDAAVAAAFALAVVYPEAGNLGGGGFLVTRLADGRTAALDFRETAPAAASRDMYRTAADGAQPSIDGWLASGVPGSVMGLWEAHRRYGKRPWRELLAPAIALADSGFPVDAHLHGVLLDARARLAGDSVAAALFYPGGEPLAEGSWLRLPELAATLRRIARRGAAGFYRGETAALVERETKAHGGLITRADLARYRARWREPVEFRYRGLRVLSMPPSSSGGLTLALMAGILQGYDLTALGWHSTEALHLTSEAMRRAFADRNAWLGDPDFVAVPRDSFLSPARAARLRAGIDPRRATPSASLRPGPAAAGTHTTHLGVVDAQGNAVALTTTLNELFGSGVALRGAGFFLNDEMDDFTTWPGRPNMFGLVQGEANAIAPGRRPLSAMTPTIVLDGAGRPLIVTGARGGPRIISAVFQVLSNIVDYGMDAGDAVDAPRVHQQHLPDTLYYEPGGFAPALLDSLRATGQALAPMRNIGNAPTIVRGGGVWIGLPDPRSGGAARGY